MRCWPLLGLYCVLNSQTWNIARGAAFAQVPTPEQAALTVNPSPSLVVPHDPSRLEFDLQALLTPGGLTSEEVARRAVATAPSIPRAMAAAQLAKASVARALLEFYPRIELHGDYTRVNRVMNPSLFGGITPEQETQLRSLIGSVDDAEARALFGLSVDRQLSFANFSFPVLQNQYSLRATLSYPVSDIFLRILPHVPRVW